MNAHSTLPIDRREERKHLFLVATLSFGRSTAAVRVRNLSATGALVESADVPPTGTEIVFRRGTLEAFGSVVWAGAGKAGLMFREPLAVASWLPEQGARREVERKPLGGEATRSARDLAISPAALALELSAVCAQLGQLGEQLALNPGAPARSADVQLLIAVEQRIARIVALLFVADSASSAPAVRNHS